MNSEVFIAHDTVVQFKYEEVEVNRLSQNQFKPVKSISETGFKTRAIF